MTRIKTPNARKVIKIPEIDMDTPAKKFSLKIPPPNHYLSFSQLMI
jgi:hypothetical protein